MSLLGCSRTHELTRSRIRLGHQALDSIAMNPPKA
jgi:hypothetical protein